MRSASLSLALDSARRNGQASPSAPRASRPMPRAIGLRPSQQRMAPSGGALVQRKCACEDGPNLCPECARRKNSRPASDPVVSRAVGLPPVVHEVVSSPGHPLEPGERAKMEDRFGRDFDAVRIHTGPDAARSAEALNAHAFTVGHDIVFANGAYRPHEQEGRRLLAHELTHVVQQGGAASGPGLELAPSDGAGEREADSVSARVVAETGSRAGPGTRTFVTQVGTETAHVALGPTTVARQAAPASQSRLQCINRVLSSAGIPWAILALAASVCGLIGAIAGLAGGPAAPATSPSGALVGAAACLAAVTGASFGMVFAVITRCIQDPSVNWVFAQNEAAGGAAGSTGEATPETGATATA